MLELLQKVYLLGFSVSSEGYNAGHPFNDEEEKILSDKDWIGRRDSLLSKLELPFLTGVKVDAQGIYDYVQSYEWRGDNGDYIPNDADREMLEDAIVGYLSSIEVGIPATGSPTRPAAPVEGLNLNIDKEWFEKKAAQEGDLEIGVGRRTSTSKLKPEEITELERIAFEALPQWAQDELTRLRTVVAAPVEGLETVGYVTTSPTGAEVFQRKPLVPGHGQFGYKQDAVVTRSQADELLAAERAETMRQVKHWSELYKQQHYRAEKAEAIIAAERTESDEAYELGKRDGYSEAAQEIDLKTGGDGEYRYCTDHDPEQHTPDPASMIQRIVERFETLNTMESVSEINEWKRRANEAEANNEALTARVKELSDLIDGENCADTDKIDALFRRAETAETQLTAAKDALEIVANAHASNPSLAMADVPEADYVRHVLYEMRKLARAALEDRP